MAKGERKAVLVVSFGTAGGPGREAIAAVERAVADAFSDYEVRRAFTSRFIIDRLKKRDGEEIDNVGEAMERLLADGVGQVVIQPTHVMGGYEYENLRETAARYESRFQSAAYGGPLLDRDEDFRELVQILAKETERYRPEGTAAVFMGHGTGHTANAAYARLNTCLKAAGYSGIYIGTMEAVPSLEDVLREVQAGRYRRIVLLPLLITAGEHAVRDMAGEAEESWKSRFRAAGYETECVLKGLGEYPGVRKMFVKHVGRALEEKRKEGDAGQCEKSKI